MNWRKVICGVFLFGFALVLAGQSASDSEGADPSVEVDGFFALGFDEVDLRTLRMIFRESPYRQFSSAASTPEMSEHWRRVSGEGRQLMLRESSLSLVVVSTRGEWTYRSADLHQLRQLPLPVRRAEDYADLGKVVSDPWYREVRKFQLNQLFSSNSTNYGQRQLNLLQEVSGLEVASAEQRQWMTVQVGRELASLDGVMKASLFQDERYSSLFGEAIAASERAAERQWNELQGLLSGDDTQTPDRLVSGELPEDFLRLPSGLGGEGRSPDLIKEVNERLVFGFPQGDETLWIAPKSDSSSPEAQLTPEAIRELLETKEAEAFLTADGSDAIIRIESHM